MLDVNLSATTPAIVHEVVAELRRKHVSRFPMLVHSDDARPMVVRFVDTRFPTHTYRTDKCAAVLDCDSLDTKGRRIYSLTSRLIQNQKFASHNQSYRIKETADPAKLSKLLRDYAKPFTSLEIMHMDYAYQPTSDEELWRAAPDGDFKAIVRTISPNELAEELMYLQSVGVQFRSEKFQRVITEGVELYREAKRRQAIVNVTMHVYIQPDASVLVTVDHNEHIGAGAWTYPTMEQAPPCVQQQVAMLRICEGQSHLPEVGRMVNDNRFWVHVNPNDFKATNS